MSLLVALNHQAGPIILKSTDGKDVIASCDVNELGTAMCLSPDATQVAYVSGSAICIWLVTEDRVHVVTTFVNEITSHLLFNKAGDHLLTTKRHGSQSKLELLTLRGEKIWSAPVDMKQLEAICFTHSGDRIICTAQQYRQNRSAWLSSYEKDPNDNIVVLAAASGEILERIAGGKGQINCLAASPLTNTIGVGRMGAIILWDADTGGSGFGIAQPFKLSQDLVWALAFSSNAQKLMCYFAGSKTVKVWDVSVGTELHSISLGIGGNLVTLTWSSSDNLLAYGEIKESNCWSVHVFDVAANMHLREIRGAHPLMLVYSEPHATLL
jgi:WD40 repeat protein